ncbi:MAG: AmmeMemoRadiSam system protein B [candidate division Zixibacteria bacterium]|nr:AmmeMemoRadiSam system protein B [candidate division Zixibacteria bacterium]
MTRANISITFHTIFYDESKVMRGNRTEIRKPAVAGMFYPGNAAELAKTIAGFYAEVKKTPLDGVPIAVIAPHAGYPYSGRVAASAFKLLEGEEIETVVVVAPFHAVFFRGSSVYEGAGYETPLGVVPIDRALSERIAGIHPNVYFSNMGHSTGSTRGEHSLEVMLPFLQIALGKFKLVAIVMGEQEPEAIRALGETLGAALKGTNTLMVASTDLSHFHNVKKAEKLDSAVRVAVERYDPDLLLNILASGRGEACGGGAMAAVLMASKRLGGKKVQLLRYAHSGETTGDMTEVVGYFSAAVVADKRAVKKDSTIGTPAPSKEDKERLSDDDRRLLLQIAREAVEAELMQKEYHPPEANRLNREQGAFVTIKIDGQLRGCIGQIRARDPLYKVVADMARAAAFEDPRFPALSREEFDRLDFEISVLSPLERVREISEIKVGRDGLMIKLGMHSGLLLPQVAAEYGWDVIEFLEQTCLKAGLSKNSFKDKFAELYKFTADVF